MKKIWFLLSFVLMFFACEFHLGWGDSITPNPTVLPKLCKIDEYKEVMTDDRDGQVYGIVSIGGIYWMAQNLNYATNESIRNSVYGRLYDWHEALQACPPGWHLPTDEEWLVLVRHYDPAFEHNSTVAFDQLFTCRRDGFNASLAGYKLPEETTLAIVHNRGSNGYYWSSTAVNDTMALDYGFRWSDKGENKLYRLQTRKDQLLSCRCVQD